MTIKRDTFAFFPEPGVMDGSMEVTSGEQSVTFEVTEEVAVDGYGGLVICCASLPRAEAERLRDWLIEVLA